MYDSTVLNRFLGSEVIFETEVEVEGVVDVENKLQTFNIFSLRRGCRKYLLRR